MDVMWWEAATPLDIAGRLTIVGFFLFVGVGNLRPSRIENHLAMARAVNVPWPRPLFFMGTTLNVVSSLCLLSGWNDEYGALGLMVFVVLAMAIYQPFWKFADPPRRNAMRNSFLSNVCILGGLLLLLQNALAQQ